MVHSMKTHTTAGAALIIVAGVFGCSDDTTSDDDGTGGDGGSGVGGSPAGTGGTGGEGGAGGAQLGHGTGTTDAHIHSVQFFESSKSLIIGTHDGLFRTEPGASELVTVMLGPDFMGFIQNPFTATTYWGSGHYASGGFSNWGFSQSTDSGVTWAEVTLTGTVDFHEMAVSPDAQGLVAGVWTWNGQVYVSADAGVNWDNYAWAPEVTSMEIEDPTGPVLLLASSAGIDRVVLPTLTSTRVVTGVSDVARSAWRRIRLRGGRSAPNVRRPARELHHASGTAWSHVSSAQRSRRPRESVRAHVVIGRLSPASRRLLGPRDRRQLMAYVDGQKPSQRWDLTHPQ